MKKTSVLALLLTIATLCAAQASPPQSAPEVFAKVKWYGQNSLRLEMAGKVIWIDPAYGPTAEKADIILVTHSHADHFAASRMKRLSRPDTTVLVGFSDFTFPRIQVGETKTLGEITIQAVPMYDQFSPPQHDKSSGFCGYLISAGGVTVYIAGDAGLMPELASIRCDIAFLPLGQTYTFQSVDQAIEAATIVGAKFVAPVHYGLYEGNEADALRFVEALKAKGVGAVLMTKN